MPSFAARFRALVCWLLCLRALAPNQARANALDCSAQHSDYLATIDRALHEYQVGHFQGARGLFAEAHALCPSARTLRGLGLAAFELGLYPEAAELLGGALSQPIRPLDGALREATALLLARAQGFVATLHLTLRPSSTVVRIDGLAVLPPARGTLELAVGEHLLELSALGHVPQRVPLVAHAGESVALQIALAPLTMPEIEPVAARVRVPEAQRPDERRKLASQLAPRASTPASHAPCRIERWLWTGLGALSVATALSLGFGLTARRSETSAAISATPIATRAGP